MPALDCYLLDSYFPLFIFIYLKEVLGKNIMIGEVAFSSSSKQTKSNFENKLSSKVGEG